MSSTEAGVASGTLGTLGTWMREKRLLPGDSLRGDLELALMALATVCVAGFFIIPHGRMHSFASYALALVVAVYLVLRPHLLRWSVKSRTLFFSILLLIYLSLSAVGSGELELVAYAGANALLIVTFLFALLLVVRSRPRSGFAITCITVAAAASAAAYYLLGSMNDDAATAWGRLRTPTIAAMAFGSALVMALGGIVSCRSQRELILWIPAIALLSAACLALAVDYVGFGVASALLILSLERAWQNRFGRQGAIWAVVAIISLGVCAQLLTSVAAGPVAVWESVLSSAFEDAAILGAGIHVAGDVGLACDGCDVDHAHSIYVSMLRHGGVIGLLLLTALVMFAISELTEAPASRLRTVGAGCLAYGLIVLVFDGDKLMPKIDFIWLLFWFPVGLVIALRPRRGRVA